MNRAIAMLRHHVSGAILRGSQPIEGRPVLFFSGDAIRECGKPQPSRAGVIACRFMVKHNGRWRRLYVDTRSREHFPHFIISGCERLPVGWRIP